MVSGLKIRPLQPGQVVSAALCPVDAPWLWYWAPSGTTGPIWTRRSPPCSSALARDLGTDLVVLAAKKLPVIEARLQKGSDRTV